MTKYNDPLLDSVSPIFQHEENNNVSIAGTSVLVSHLNQTFLVTAAHVLRDNGNENPLFLSFEGNNIQLDGPALMTPINRENDLDIAVFDLRMQPTLLELFNGYKINSLESPEHLPIHTRSHYYIFGYPFRKAKYNKENKLVEITPLDYITDEVADDVYDAYEINKQTNILVSYNPKNTHNKKKMKTTAPHPHGASGGPLLRILVDENDNPIILIFEGIMTKWKAKKAILSTRKSIIKSFIKDNYF